MRIVENGKCMMKWRNKGGRETGKGEEGKRGDRTKRKEGTRKGEREGKGREEGERNGVEEGMI